MKNANRLFGLLIFLSISLGSWSQDETKITIDHSNANETLKITDDYIKMTVAGNIDEAKSFLADNYMHYGPGFSDSADAAAVVKQWHEDYKVLSNRSINLIYLPVSVSDSPIEGISGDWVHAWGTYHITQNGIDLIVPMQVAVKIVDGKIEVSRIYYDNLSIARKLGFKLTPPKPIED